MAARANDADKLLIHLFRAHIVVSLLQAIFCFGNEFAPHLSGHAMNMNSVIRSTCVQGYMHALDIHHLCIYTCSKRIRSCCISGSQATLVSEDVAMRIRNNFCIAVMRCDVTFSVQIASAARFVSNICHQFRPVSGPLSSSYLHLVQCHPAEYVQKVQRAKGVRNVYDIHTCHSVLSVHGVHNNTQHMTVRSLFSELLNSFSSSALYSFSHTLPETQTSV